MIILNFYITCAFGLAKNLQLRAKIRKKIKLQNILKTIFSNLILGLFCAFETVSDWESKN